MKSEVAKKVPVKTSGQQNCAKKGALRGVARANVAQGTDAYQLDQQIGYLLRLANQRHLEIFNQHMPDLTPTQFAVLARLLQVGPLSQNELGRQVGIDGATTNGVIDRLQKKQLIKTAADKQDKRRLRISLTEAGEAQTTVAIATAMNITNETLQALSDSEARQLRRLLVKLQQT